MDDHESSNIDDHEPNDVDEHESSDIDGHESNEGVHHDSSDAGQHDSIDFGNHGLGDAGDLDSCDSGDLDSNAGYHESIGAGVHDPQPPAPTPTPPRSPIRSQRPALFLPPEDRALDNSDSEEDWQPPTPNHSHSDLSSESEEEQNVIASDHVLARLQESFRLEGCGCAEVSTELGEDMIDETQEAEPERDDLVSVARYYQAQGVLDILDTVASHGRLPIVSRTALSSTPWEKVLGDGKQGSSSPSLDLHQSCSSKQQTPFQIRRTYDIDACFLPLYSLGAVRTPSTPSTAGQSGS